MGARGTQTTAADGVTFGTTATGTQLAALLAPGAVKTRLRAVPSLPPWRTSTVTSTRVTHTIVGTHAGEGTAGTVATLGTSLGAVSSSPARVTLALPAHSVAWGTAGALAQEGTVRPMKSRDTGLSTVVAGKA